MFDRTWVNPRGDLPKNSRWSCGPRCSAVLALQFRDTDDDNDGALYDCDVTVSAVRGATEVGHEIPDNVARIIAGGIGLEGYSNGPNDWEYSRYPPGYVSLVNSEKDRVLIYDEDLRGVTTEVEWTTMLQRWREKQLVLLWGQSPLKTSMRASPSSCPETRRGSVCS